MYSKGFLNDLIAPMGEGQFPLLSWSVATAVRVVGPHQAICGTAFASIQILIGLGLLITVRTVKLALILSFISGSVVWWWGEGLGMVFMGMASPLTGAPGAVLLYGVIGIMVWPTGRAGTVSAASAGLLGDRGGRIVWTALWVFLGLLMLLPVNAAGNATSAIFSSITGAAPGPLAVIDRALAHATTGGGIDISIVLALILVLIGVGVLWDRLRNGALIAGMVLAALIWLTAENLGGS